MKIHKHIENSSFMEYFHFLSELGGLSNITVYRISSNFGTVMKIENTFSSLFYNTFNHF